MLVILFLVIVCKTTNLITNIEMQEKLKIWEKPHILFFTDEISLKKKVEKGNDDVKTANFIAFLSNKPVEFKIALTSGYFLGESEDSLVVYLSIYLSISLSLYLSIYLSIYLPILSVYLLILFVCLSILIKCFLYNWYWISSKVIVHVWDMKHSCGYILSEDEFMNKMDAINAFEVSN